MEAAQGGKNRTKLLTAKTGVDADVPNTNVGQGNAMEVHALGGQFKDLFISASPDVHRNQAYVQNDSKQTNITQDVEPKPPEPFVNPFI